MKIHKKILALALLGVIKQAPTATRYQLPTPPSLLYLICKIQLSVISCVIYQTRTILCLATIQKPHLIPSKHSNPTSTPKTIPTSTNIKFPSPIPPTSTPTQPLHNIHHKSRGPDRPPPKTASAKPISPRQRKLHLANLPPPPAAAHLYYLPIDKRINYGVRT